METRINIDEIRLSLKFHRKQLRLDSEILCKLKWNLGLRKCIVKQDDENDMIENIENIDNENDMVE